MRHYLLLICMVLGFLLLACKDELTVSPPVRKTISFQEVDSGKYDCFSIPDSGTTIVRHDSVWLSYWNQYWLCTFDGTRKTPPPTIDFSKTIAIMVHFGTGYSGCRNRIEVIKEIYSLNDTIHVSVDRLPFLGSCAAWIKPLEIVTIPRSIDPIVFEKYKQ